MPYGLSDGWDDIQEKAFAKRFDYDSVKLTESKQALKHRLHVLFMCAKT